MPPWIERVVQRLEPKHSWDDLETPSETLEKIKGKVISEKDAALKGRSAASDITVLFSGPELGPKLLAAEAIASESGTAVYRIDLAMLVTEDVLETERIMKRILDAAEDAGGVIFFDAGDSLVRPAEDDPYPERGGNYLLKRMGKFAGVSILSVTDRTTVDPALVRRFRHIVSFE